MGGVDGVLELECGMTHAVLELNPIQSEFLTAKEDAVLLRCGRGFGKSYIGSTWACMMMLQHPRACGLITDNTQDQLAHATLAVLLERMRVLGIEYVFNRKPPWYRSRFPSGRHNGVLSAKCGAQVCCRSMTKWDTIRGAEYGWAWFDEVRDTKKEAFEVALACMRDPNMPLVGRNRYWRPLRCTTTPDGFDWTAEYFEDEPAEKPHLALKRRCIVGETYDNARHLGEDFIELLESSYDDDMAAQEIRGERVNVGTGAVYTTFDRNIHLDAEIVYHEDRDLYLSCDFNVTPMAWVIGQPFEGGPSEGVGIIGEIYRKHARAGMSASESAARDFMRIYGDHPGKVIVFGDPSGENSSSSTTQTDYSELFRVLAEKFAGRIETRVAKGHPAVIDRVNATNAAFRNSLGEVRCKIHPRCRYLRLDLEQVVWTKSAIKRQIDKITDKSLTHPSDALGYMLHRLYRAPKSFVAGSTRSDPRYQPLGDDDGDREFRYVNK